MKKYHFAIDGNEANVKNRVGSNVYAFHIIEELSMIVENSDKYEFTVLLSSPPAQDLPKKTKNWQYRVIGPEKFWTQLAAPWHLYTHQFDYHAYYTPGHYAPRYCAVPYISSVMDLAFLKFPDQFKKNDLTQLKSWTEYSVKNANKIIAISNFTKNEIVDSYRISPSKIIVAEPDVSLPEKPSTKAELIKYLMKFGIRQPYFLYIGTLQPRKNLINLITAYEIFYDEQLSKEVQSNQLPQLVIGGKVGWMADDILARINNSVHKANIIVTDYVPDIHKPELYKVALATILVGLYEGFGIPPLESIHFLTLPIVSSNSSLPEVVGPAGLMVNPHKVSSIAEALTQTFSMPSSQLKILKEKMISQRAKFSWSQSAEKIFKVLVEVADNNEKFNEK